MDYERQESIDVKDRSIQKAHDKAGVMRGAPASPITTINIVGDLKAVH